MLPAQEWLTRFHALPDLGRKILAAKAIKAVGSSVSTAQPVVDAREAMAAYNSASEVISHLDDMNIVLVGYFVLESRRRENNDIAAMIALGIL